MEQATYREAEVRERTGLTRTRLAQLRSGYSSKGVDYLPALEFGTDWYRAHNGRPLYTEAGVARIQHKHYLNRQADDE